MDSEPFKQQPTHNGTVTVTHSTTAEEAPGAVLTEGVFRTPRDRRLDLMRFFGIVLVITAHAEPPNWLFQLRNFGTPLLVAASALTYATIYQSREIKAGPFLRKRLTKLIIPAWCFLTFFFTLFALSAAVTERSFPFSAKEIVTSYTFYSGIGFVWIFKVYIALAMITPSAIRFAKLPLSSTAYFGWLLAAYGSFEVAVAWVPKEVLADRSGFLNSVLLTLPPYFLLFLYSLRLKRLSDRQLLLIGGVGIIVFLIASWYVAETQGFLFPVQKFKYPPRAYYICYGFSAIHFIYFTCRQLDKLASTRPLTWVSENSLWIYLWHILAIYIWRFFEWPTEPEMRWFLPHLAFLLVVGIALTWVQQHVFACMLFLRRREPQMQQSRRMAAPPLR